MTDAEGADPNRGDGHDWYAKNHGPASPTAPEPLPSWAMAGWALGLSLAGVTPVAFGLAIAVLVRSRKDGRNHGKGLAIAALICSVVITVLTVAVIAMYFLNGWDETRRDDDGRIVDEGAVSTDRLRVGDCFDDQTVADAPPESYEIDASGEVLAVPCSEPHQFETIHILEVAGDDFPGMDAIHSHAAGCLDVWEEFTGTPYLSDERYELSYYYPDERSWRWGARRIVCNIYPRDESLMIGSILGTE